MRKVSTVNMSFNYTVGMDCLIKIAVLILILILFLRIVMDLEKYVIIFKAILYRI